MLFGGCVQTSTLISTSNGECLFRCTCVSVKTTSACICIHASYGLITTTKGLKLGVRQHHFSLHRKKNDCQIIIVKPQKHVWCLRPTEIIARLVFSCKLHDGMKNIKIHNELNMLKLDVYTIWCIYSWLCIVCLYLTAFLLDHADVLEW